MVKGHKGDWTSFLIKKIFWCTTIAIMLNPCFKALHVVENNGTWECNITSIWVWCKSCHSCFEGVFSSIEPYYQCIATILIEVIEQNLEENMFGGGPQTKNLFKH